MQRLPSGESVTCWLWPMSPQLQLKESHSGSLSDLDSTSEQCMNAFSSARTHRRSSPFFEKVSELAASTTSCECTATHNPSGTASCRGLRRDRAAVSQTALPRSHRGTYDASDTQCWPVWNRAQKSAIQRAVWTGLLPEQILESQSSRGPPSTQKPRPSSNSISSSAQRESHCSRFFTGVAVPFTAQSTTFTGGCPTYS